MLVPGILGFQSMAVLFLLVLCLVIRQKWRNAAVRKEEVTRLLVMASEESAVVEAQFAAEYPYYPKPYQCAVCFCPTTTRCSQCKSVRYCSGKCQIIHWRQGHKDGCRPLSDSASQTQFGVYSNASRAEGKFMTSPDSLVGEEHDSCGDAKGTQINFAASSPLLFSSVNLSDDITSEVPKRKSSAKVEEPRSLPSESNFVDYVDKPSMLDKHKLIHKDEDVEFMMQLSKDKACIDEVIPEKTVNKKSVKSASEMIVTDASKRGSLPSSSHMGTRSITNEREDNIEHNKGKHVRSHSCSASADRPSSAAGGHLDNGFKPVLPAKGSSISSLPQNACNGLKTSMRKVVQQLKVSKQSKSYLLGVEKEVIGKYNGKITFPYELFMELYSYDSVELCPFGLTNCGNSCYANAVLQCLAFTRPLTSYLVRGLHSKACQKEEWCFICEFECLILKAREGESPLSPIRILSKIQQIGSHLGPGKEEDAHEFLRYAVDAMQSVCLKEAGAVGPLAEETTLVGLTFGGYLRSKIKCMKCLGKSERYERMMDLTVEIDGDIGSLDEALAQFTGTETLDGDNRYHCCRCRSYVKAKKKLTVLEAPNILTIVLKRFQSGSFGKLNKSVQFPEVLNMAPYMSGTSDKSPVYDLYAVVVHLDVMNAAFSGHYVCYVKDFRGEWFRIDDSTVMPVELERVLREGAYMLLYARQSTRAPAIGRNSIESHVARSKKRNLEAVPSSHNSSKVRSESNISNMDHSKTQQKHNRHLYYDWRSHPMERIPPADSSSESSSLFSGSDASSCSTTSTKDSVRSEDFSDYLFGEVGLEWYSCYRIPSDLGASSSYENVNGNSEARVDGNAGWLPPQGQGNPAVLYTDSSRRRRSSSSVRDCDYEQVAWANSYDVRSGVSLRRANGDRSAQTFY